MVAKVGWDLAQKHLISIIYWLRTNGKLIDAIPIKRSMEQGCLLSPLLSIVATHPLFCMIEKIVDFGEIHGLKTQFKH